MSNAPTAQQLCEKVGISPSYANKIIGGFRAPSRSLAVAIYRKFGWKHDTIAALTDTQIRTLEQIEPWVAPASRPANTEKAA